MNAKTILICDDDETILAMLEFIFESRGFRIIAIKNSLNVLSVVKEQKPDLLLLDLSMPFYSGEHIVKSMKTSADTKNIPVIIISGTKDGREIATKAGVSAFFPKPFDVSELTLTVDQYLSI